jgi:hypothetical protein
MFDYEIIDVLGKNAAELFSYRKIRQFVDVLSIIDSNRNRTEEFIVNNKDGVSFPISITFSPVLFSTT